MKVWTVLAVTVMLWACCWISMVERQSSGVAKMMEEDEHKLTTFDKIIFSTKTSTRQNYMYFINELRNALLAHGGDISGNIAFLPPQTMSPTDPRRYLMVELTTTGDQTVTLALDVANAYVLGYRAGTATPFYFFNDVALDVQTVLSPSSDDRGTLSYTGAYQSLERAAGLGDQRDRRDIPLGIDHLNQHIRNMNRYNPTGTDRYRIARALLVCIQMVSEAARFRNIEQQIAQVAEQSGGIYGEIYPDDLMLGFQTNWGRLSTAVQTAATNGIFGTVVSVTNELRFETIASVRFLLALVLVVCERRGLANPYYFLHTPLPASIISTGLERNDEKCEDVLEPTSYITGRDGMCLEVNQGDYRDGNWIALSTCIQNRGFQLWTFRSDNTIRSGGKCLTTYGYEQGNYVMIYDCNTAVTDATKWEMQSDGSIRNPRSKLLLVAEISKGVPWLVVGLNIFSSKQAFYATNNTNPLVTTIVGDKGLCLLASGSQVWLEKCVRNDGEQKWNIYPDGSIRPQNNQKWCLKYGDGGGDSVIVGTCDGWIEERWGFQYDGTILHLATDQVMDVKDTTSAFLPQITVNDYNHQRLSQIWFQVQP